MAIFVYSEFENNVPQGRPEINVEARLLNTHDECREGDRQM